jgi:hypothetical protein
MNSSILLRSTFRRNISKGPNIKKTIVTKNQRVVDCHLWGMINCTDNTENKLKTEILKFSNLASNPAIQQAFCIYAKSWKYFQTFT